MASTDVADRLAGLVEVRLPLAVPSEGNQDDWNIIGPTLLVAAIRHLRALQRLQDDFPSALIGWQLLRSLFEYVVTLAWIAHDPSERAKRWLKSDFQQRLKMDDDFAALGTALLQEGVRAEFEAYEPQLEGLPPVPNRARAADAEWEAILEELDDRLPEEFRRFRGLYPLIFRNGSQFIHPTTHGVNALIEGEAPDLRVTQERPLERDLLLIGDGLVALGLAIASVATPAAGIEIEQVRAALE